MKIEGTGTKNEYLSTGTVDALEGLRKYAENPLGEYRALWKSISDLPPEEFLKRYQMGASIDQNQIRDNLEEVQKLQKKIEDALSNGKESNLNKKAMQTKAIELGMQAILSLTKEVEGHKELKEFVEAAGKLLIFLFTPPEGIENMHDVEAYERISEKRKADTIELSTRVLNMPGARGFLEALKKPVEGLDPFALLQKHLLQPFRDEVLSFYDHATLPGEKIMGEEAKALFEDPEKLRRLIINYFSYAMDMFSSKSSNLGELKA